MSDRVAHWLRKNAAARIPRRVICIDTEAYLARSLQGSRHSFRLASLTFDRLSVEAEPQGETKRLDFGTTKALWGYIDSFTSTSHRTVVFAHNLSYDLRLSNGLLELSALGWDCKAIVPSQYSCWARFQNGKRSLWLSDSLSFVPAALEKIALELRIEKPPLPDDDAPDETWLARCRADVEATREAMLRVLRFIRAEDCGDFRLTGSAQASAAFRHRFLLEKTLLVHADDAALERERAAAHTGRAEVWRHGTVNAPIYEYDYEYSYARIAQTCEVPTRLLAVHTPLPRIRMERMMEKYAVLADCVVSTDVPLVPCRNGSHTIWPVGEFRTTLWDNELRLLYDHGASVTVERFYYYKRAPILSEWADWIIGLLESPEGALDPVVRLMLKDWTRSLIGRFGLRYSSLDEIAKLPGSDVRLYGVGDADGAAEATYLQIGRQLFEQMERVESPNSTPMVMSWIMAQARVRLWEAMQSAHLGSVFYCDTDGFLCDKDGSRRLDTTIGRSELPGLRRKTRFTGGTFRAPRNIDLGETRRVSGAPRKSERLAHSTYRGEVWESLPTALRRKHIRDVFVHERTFHVSDHDPRRLHLADGSTAPLVLSLETQSDSSAVA